MREIKFRAWDKVNEKFQEIESIVFGKNDLPTNINNRYQIQNEGQIVLMQFTGLYDKNGKEIYELDRVVYQDEKGEIKWRDFRWHFYNENGYCGDIMRGEDFEVIGNVWENPELLTQS